MSPMSRTARLRGAVASKAVATCAVVAAFALTSSTAAPAHADPGICIDHVMENGYEATDAVLRACKIAKTGRLEDFLRCQWILADEGVDDEVAEEACRIASYPEQTAR